jgi:hypothetical protein
MDLNALLGRGVLDPVAFGERVFQELARPAGFQRNIRRQLTVA